MGCGESDHSVIIHVKVTLYTRSFRCISLANELPYRRVSTHTDSKVLSYWFLDYIKTVQTADEILKMAGDILDRPHIRAEKSNELIIAVKIGK